MYKKSMVGVILFVLCAAFMPVANADLVLHWTLDEGSGTVAKDSSGNGNDGVVGGAANWVTGNVRGALDFDASSTYIEQGNALVTGNCSIALWMMPRNLPYSTDYRSIMHGDVWEAGCIHGHLRANTSLINFEPNGGGAVSSTTVCESDEWYHAVAAFDTGTGEGKLYINGVLETTSSGVSSSLYIGALNFGAYTGSQRYFDGIMDDIRIYDHAVTAEEVPGIMAGSAAELASEPSPADEAEDVLRDVTLEWVPGEFAATHDLYMGDSFTDVNDATVPTGLALDANSFDMGRLEFGKTVFWRVDEVNGIPDKTVFKGEVWSFEVEPYSIQIAGSDIIATASSSSNDFSLPGKTIDGSGLKADGTHGIATEAMWFTDMGDTGPWIQYEFEGIKQLDVAKIWNSNSSAEGFIGYGVNGVLIEYSTDGETWETFEVVTELSRAPGLSTYDQYDEIDFGAVAAKMVRLNIQSNFGGFIESYSLSEVQFNMIPAAARTPIPESEATGVVPNAVVSWRAGRAAAQSTVYVSTDPNEVADGLAPSATSNTNSIDLSSFDLQMGETYYWRVDEVNNAEAVPVWAGPVWSFSTVDAMIVDDFESYGNDSPDRPFQAWLDGYGYSSDEFFPAGYAGNGTGAGVGHDIWSVASDYYNGDIMETASTIPGSGQSLPFYFTNSGGVASETKRTFTVPQDWTVGGAVTLSIAFNGQVGNTGTMFALINNAKVVYDRDNGNISRGSWQAWNIDLSAVNTTLSNVTTLKLGVEGSGASGMILFDDIRLFAKAGELLTPTDPGANGLVGAWSFDEGSGAVVADSSGNGRNGTIVDATWEPGIQGSALLFNGVSSYVNIDGYKGINAVDTVQQAFTIANWVNTTSDTGDTEMVTWGASSGSAGRLTWRVHEGRVRTEHNAGNLRGNTYINDGEWHHVALAVTEGANLRPENTKLYVDGSEDSTFSGADVTYNLVAEHDVRIGMSGPQNGRYFPGALDEIRIYDRALPAEEIFWLAGRTDPIDKPF